MGAALLKNDDVKRWYENLKEGSERTGDVYLVWLQQFVDFTKASPTASIQRFKSGESGKKQVQDSLFDFIQHLKEKGLAPKSMNGALSAVRSWFRWNECLITRQIKIRGTKTTPTLEDERLPTKQEVNQALNFGDLRQKICIGITAFAGLRFISTSKLRIKDLLDVRIKDDQVTIDNQNTRVRVTVLASKNRLQYFCFLPVQLTEWIREYLQSRLRDGEQLDPESLLVVTSERHFSKGRFVEKGAPLTRNSVAKDVRICFRAAGQKARPYVLKSYYSMALQSAGLTFDKTEFYLGHVGPMNLNYGMRKELPAEKIEELRTEFVQKVEPVLTGPRQVIGEDDVKEIVLASLSALATGEDESLLAAGIDPDIIKGVREVVALGNEPKSKSSGLPEAPIPLKELGTNGTGAKYDVRVCGKADEKAIVGLLEQGYAWVQDMGADKAVYRKKREE